MAWRSLDEQPVYQNQWFSVHLADVELPDGRHLDHYLIRQRPAALAAAINDRNEVLLLWRHRFITDSWGWELPAGVVEDGETTEQAAAREMLEETGWRAGTRRDWVALDRVPDLIGNGEIHNASTIAALLLLHHMRVR